ncbi:MAG: hypothetical protein KIT31_21285 [Deltaproteobacteria bacterium]|nr:hypothetical protein [Deltaproteobacteria bacterium]
MRERKSTEEIEWERLHGVTDKPKRDRRPSPAKAPYESPRFKLIQAQIWDCYLRRTGAA